MTVCRYFQTNSCRYGSKCRYEHVRESPMYSYDGRQLGGVSILQRESQPPPRQYHQPENRTYQNDKYHYQSEQYSKRYQQQPDQKFNQYRSPMAQTKSVSNVRDYLEMIAKEVALIENQNLWPLVCLGIFRGHSSLPEWVDYSPEELRYEAYKAQKENNFEAYVTEVQRLLDKAKEVRRCYLLPNKMTESIIKQLLEQSKDKEGFNMNTSNSVFQSNTSVDPGSMSALSTKNNSFSSGPVFSFDNTSAFGPSSQPIPQNIFGSVFNQGQQANVFGGPVQNNRPSMFESSNEMMGGSIFGNQRSANDQCMIVGNETTPNFGKQEKSNLGNGNQNVMIEPSVEDLTKKELEQYQANIFTFGLIPTIPPPAELCPI